MVRGNRLSTSVVGGAVVFQVAVMVLARGRPGRPPWPPVGAPFRWSSVTGGLGGLVRRFPLALLHVHRLGERAGAGRGVPRPAATGAPGAVRLRGHAAGLFVLFAYATVTGFGYDVSSVGRSSIPFLTVADGALGPVAVVAWLAGVVSCSPRWSRAATAVPHGVRRRPDGQLPSWLGVVRTGTQVPVRALVAFVTAGLGVIGVWALAHLVGSGTGSMNPVGLYAECSTFGTIVILFVYLLSMAALPRYIWTRHRDRVLGGPRRQQSRRRVPPYSSSPSSRCAPRANPIPIACSRSPLSAWWSPRGSSVRSWSVAERPDPASPA